MRVDQPSSANDFNRTGRHAGGRVWRRGSAAADRRARSSGDDEDLRKPILHVARRRYYKQEESGKCAVEAGATAGAYSGESRYAQLAEEFELAHQLRKIPAKKG